MKEAILEKAEEQIKLQKAIFDYAYRLKRKFPGMSDARIKRKVETYFKRSLKTNPPIGTVPLQDS